ncbi:MAG: hypothetical protein JXK04_01295 [Campylobacterales bacterium]|nr:hypothetical protein [Campylobacterales bacterium]
MPLRYAGPKPLISAHGIEFDLNKEDKFVYLSIAAELIQALDHEYVAEKRYSYIASGKPLPADEILSAIRLHDPLIDQEMQMRRHTAEQELREELERAQTNKLLSDEEREVLIKNIRLMHTYRVNRAVNKTVYYSAIASIASIIKAGHIDYIAAPMFPKFIHLFHSLQGVLAKLHPPIESAIDIYEEDGHLHTRLNILFRN